MTPTNSCHHTGQQLFTPITHPELRQLGRRAIDEFVKARQRYLQRISDIDAQGGVATAISLKSSFDPDLLLSLVEFKEFKDVNTVEELNEDVLKKWLKEKTAISLDSITPHDLEQAVIANVQINIYEDDPELRIKNLFMEYKKFLRSRHWDTLITINPQVATTHICALLKPAELQGKILADLSLCKTALKTDWLSFYQYVIEQAVQCNPFIPVRSASVDQQRGEILAGEIANTSEALKNTSFHSSAGCIPARTNRKTSTLSVSPCSPPKRSNTVSSAGSKNITAAAGEDKSQDASKKQLPLCLNKEKCNGRHMIRDCPRTSSQEKEKFLKEYYAERSKSGRLNSLSHTHNSEACESLQGTGRYFAKLADTVSVIVNGDYGADHSALSQYHLDKCAEQGVFVSVLPLSTPIPVSLAMETSNDTNMIYAHKKARVSTTLMTSEGPFRLRNLEFLVFDQNMPEVLISRPVLQSLGFNLDAHIASVRSIYHDTDFSDVGFERRAQGDTNTCAPAATLSMILGQKYSNEDNVKEMPLHLEADEPTFGSKNVQGANSATDVHPGSSSDVLYDDGITLETLEAFVGEESADEVHANIQHMIDNAMREGLPKEYAGEFSSLLFEYADIFRTKLGTDPPIRAPPMNIRLKKDAKPVRVKARRYTPQQQAFMRSKIDEFLRLGIVKPNNESAWACAPLIVPKSGTEGFRFTVDLRPVNMQTVPHCWPMPNIESATAQLAGTKCYAIIDLCHGYFQLALDEDSQECQSFITCDGVYTPTRVLQGQTNAAAFFQSTLQQLLSGMKDDIIQWLDDFLLYAKSSHTLILKLRLLFAICRKKRIKLHATKCRLFLSEVKWCGRIISSGGIRLDPSRLQSLLQLQTPVTGADLQQFICAANWMRSVIPQFTQLVAPLVCVLEKVYEVVGARTRRAASQFQLHSQLWTDEHQQTFGAVRNALANSVMLAHPDDSKAFQLFTDASEEHWAGILTQVPPSEVDIQFAEQHHEPLAFLSGSFKGASSRWSTIEKEAYAIVSSVTRLDYLLMRPSGFNIFTDHKNLTFIFDPYSTKPGITKHVANKVERWALKLSAFRYTISHVAGDDNVWADLLSRWGSKPMDEGQSVQLSALFRAPVAPALDPEYTWPSEEEIYNAQRAALDEGEEPMGCLKNGLIRSESGIIWIPSKSIQLQMRICIVGHCGRGGHRGVAATTFAIKSYCVWNTIEADIKAFCNSCLHCLSTIGGEKVARPMGHALHADKPNELIHFDFLYMGDSNYGYSYVLIIMDDASIYSWLEPCKSADAVTASQTLLKWFTTFGVALSWNSDRGPHFKNKLMNALNRALHAHHHFTTPYTPQANGTVEATCRQVLRATRALLSEFRMRSKDWPSVLPLVQSIINHTPRTGLANLAPITIMTQLPADNPLRTMLKPGTAKTKSISFIKAQKLCHVQSLQKSLEEFHKGTAASRTRNRDRAIKAHNRKTNVQDVNFDVGDFVLVAKVVSQQGDKLCVKWTGPQRITRALSDYTYEVEDMISKKLHTIHCNRLKFYADSSLNVTQELLDSIDHNSPHYETVTKILGLRFNKAIGRYEVCCKWRGFDHEEPTWEPMDIMREDIPDMLDRFLDSYSDKDLVKAARNA